MCINGRRIVGYARASVTAPRLEDQINALRAAGCLDDNIWVETECTHFPQLALALLDARDGDTFAVHKLICLSNSFKRLGRVLSALQSRGIPLWILDVPFDTRRVAFTRGLLRLLARKRHIKSLETREGLATARAAGRIGGRREALSAESIATAHELLRDPRHTLTTIADQLGVSRSTLYKFGLRRRQPKKIGPPRRGSPDCDTG